MPRLVRGTLRARSRRTYDANGDLHRRIEELERIVAQMPVSRMPAAGRTMTVSDGQRPEAAAEPATQCHEEASCCDPYHLGQDFLNSTCRTGGLIAGAEIVFLKPFATNGDLPGSFPLIGTDADYHFDSTPRFWIGYVQPSGLGSQFRYWEFDHGVNGSLDDDPDDLITGGLEFRTFDWELLQQVNFRRWWLQMSGGLRYSEINIDERLTLDNSAIFN